MNVIYKNTPLAYNKLREPADELPAIKEEQFAVTKTFRGRLMRIKVLFREKVTLYYDSLKFDPVYKTFINRIRSHEPDEFKVIEDIPVPCRAEYCLNDLTKYFLVEHAYLALGEEYIKNRLRNRLGIFNPQEIRLLKILDFIITRIEENRMARLKKFREKSKFKTFLTTTAARLLTDYWRREYGEEAKKVKYKTDYETYAGTIQVDPLDLLLETEDESFKKSAFEVLPAILEQLDYKETLVYKMKYHHGNNVGQIAQTLGCSRYKGDQFIKRLENRIKIALLLKLKKGGR